ncbi:MAG: TetR/AcrR family transcriptional regulator [Geobacteraceae bacterium]|nr:TetR/AcrR family transcriptional regulator [Geobacteraceae bacterium]
MTKQDKRHDILRAALELFAEQGFHGAPMALIAERAGVGAGTIYRYFENRDILIRDLFNELEEDILPFIMDGYSDKAPFRARFIHLGSRLLRYFIQNPLHFRYLEQFHNSPFGVAHRRDKILGNEGKNTVFKELFEQGAEQQVLKDLPLPMLIALAFGPLLAVARDHILGFFHLDEDLVLKTIEACWDTVKR